MKLYYSPGACSMSPHIVMRELGLKFDLVKVDLGSKKTEAGDDYTKVNSKGSVPALQLDNGDVLTECAVIVQYLADNAPGNSLAAKPGSMERVRQQEWLNWIAAEFHKSMGSLFNKPLAEKAGDIFKTRIGNQLAHLDAGLAKTGYLSGSSFGLPDAYAFTVASWGQYVGVDVSKYPNVQKFMQQVGSRPSVQAMLKAEGLVS